MMSTIFARYLEKMDPVLTNLIASDRGDPEVIALLVTESFFRPKHEQLLEYFAWVILWFSNRARLARLSVGPGQIQLRHWAEAFDWPDLSPRLGRVWRASSWNESYDLATDLTADCTSLYERVVRYHGEARRYYLSLITEANDYVRHLQNRTQMVAPRPGLGRDSTPHSVPLTPEAFRLRCSL